MHQRSLNSVAKPASGPLYSVPAMGCAGTKITPPFKCFSTALIVLDLTEPTSERIARLCIEGTTALATAPIWPGGTQRITRSARGARAAASVLISSAISSLLTALQTLSDLSAIRIVLAAPLARAARATELPIRPPPMIKTVSKIAMNYAVTFGEGVLCSGSGKQPIMRARGSIFCAADISPV